MMKLRYALLGVIGIVMFSGKTMAQSVTSYDQHKVFDPTSESFAIERRKNRNSYRLFV